MGAYRLRGGESVQCTYCLDVARYAWEGVNGLGRPVRVKHCGSDVCRPQAQTLARGKAVGTITDRKVE